MANKYFSWSFDDGLEQDKRIIQILKKYGIGATFHLNSGLFGVRRYISRIGNLGMRQLLTNEFASLCLPGGNRRSSPTFGVRQPDPSAEASGLAAHRGVIDCTLPGEACSTGAVPFSGTRAFRRYSFPIR